MSNKIPSNNLISGEEDVRGLAGGKKKGGGMKGLHIGCIYLHHLKHVARDVEEEFRVQSRIDYS